MGPQEMDVLVSLFTETVKSLGGPIVSFLLGVRMQRTYDRSREQKDAILKDIRNVASLSHLYWMSNGLNQAQEFDIKRGFLEINSKWIDLKRACRRLTSGHRDAIQQVEDRLADFYDEATGDTFETAQRMANADHAARCTRKSEQLIVAISRCKP